MVLFFAGLTVEVSTRAVGQHEAEIDVDHATPSVQQDVPVVAVFHLFVNMNINMNTTVTVTVTGKRNWHS